MYESNRRAFATSLAAGVGLGWLASKSSAGATADSAPIQLGFSLYGMRKLAIDEALKQCARIGYQAVELPVMPDWPGEASKLSPQDRMQIRKQLSELHLELPALMENLPLDVDERTHHLQLDRLRVACELAHDLDSQRPPLIETILGGKVGEWMKLRDQFARRVGEWNKIAQQTQTVVCIKAHRMGAMNRPEDAVWLVEQIASPWIQLAYDYSHFQHRDMTIGGTLDKLIRHTRFVHVKDTIVENEKARFVLPGDGGVDYRDLFSQLKSRQYTGCVCVEVSGMVQNQPNYDPIAAAERSYANLARFI